MDLSVAILMAFHQSPEIQRLFCQWPDLGCYVLMGSSEAQEGSTRDIIEVMFLFVAKPKRLLCSDILTLLGSSSDGETWWIEADGYILLLLSKWCDSKADISVQAQMCFSSLTRLYHWILWLCYCLEAISQLHSHCKLACLIMV